MRDKFDKQQMKKIQGDWKSFSEDWDDVSYEFEQETKKVSKRLRDETKDIDKGRKLNKRTYR